VAFKLAAFSMDQPACRQAGDDDIFYGQTCCVWIFLALVLISFYEAYFRG
jgi:hypothetical protein